MSQATSQHPPRLHWKGFNSASDLRNLRLLAGLSQESLAALSGFERHAVIYHEKREGRVDGVAPRRFREAFERLGVKVPDFREPAVSPPAKAGRKPAAAFGKTCGAKTRKGTPCQCKASGRGGRCKFHGGMSTGPKTAEGKARIVAARLVRAARERARQEAVGVASV